MQTVNGKIEGLRALMRNEGITAFYVGTADPHDSEYVAPHYQGRAWLSGFTGSAGTALVTLDRALLWADGRYYIQAEKELAGSAFELMKQGAPGVPDVLGWLMQNLPEGSVLGADGRLLPEAMAGKMEDALAKKGIGLRFDLDLLGPIWEDRPPLPSGKIFRHDLAYTGRQASVKIADVRSKMKEDQADYALYVGLDDIGWLYNFRGSDVPNNAVALAFALITQKEAFLFIDPVKLGSEDRDFFSGQGITVLDYDSIGQHLASLAPGRMAADKNRVSRALTASLPGDVSLVQVKDYPFLMKAVLNETELLCQIRAGIRDSLAVTRYLYFVKEEAAPRGLTEIEAAARLRELRRESVDFIIESFPTISAYGSNAAMMHYQATDQDHSRLAPRGLYLVDCGAQSPDGTTDITRTVSLGPLTPEEIADYTMTLKSHIALASLPFLSGTSGTSLDAVARSVMWRYGLDYKCGTGHGFGYLSGVHEGPQRLTHNPRFGDYGFRENNVITIEPGVYRQGKHGIRLENDYVALRINKSVTAKGYDIAFHTEEESLNENQDIFLRFQTMTFVPFDRAAIDPALLSREELLWLDDYHRAVRKALSPLLEGAELDFVLGETEPFLEQ